MQKLHETRQRKRLWKKKAKCANMFCLLNSFSQHSRADGVTEQQQQLRRETFAACMPKWQPKAEVVAKVAAEVIAEVRSCLSTASVPTAGGGCLSLTPTAMGLAVIERAETTDTITTKLFVRQTHKKPSLQTVPTTSS